MKNVAKKSLLNFKRNVKMHPIQDVESSTQKRGKNSTSRSVVEKQKVGIPIEKSKKKKKKLRIKLKKKPSSSK